MESCRVWEAYIFTRSATWLKWGLASWFARSHGHDAGYRADRYLPQEVGQAPVAEAGAVSAGGGGGGVEGGGGGVEQLLGLAGGDEGRATTLAPRLQEGASWPEASQSAVRLLLRQGPP
jgi:hypothetical protein